MDEQRRVTSAAGVVGSTTLLSRILGMVRDIVILSSFGRTATDAFYLALTIPSVLRSLLAEGAMSVAFLPVLTDYLKKGSKKESQEMISVVFTFFGLLLGTVSILGVMFAPEMVKLLAPGAGFADIPGKYLLTTELVRIIFPYLFFVAMTSLCMGVLNSQNHFLAPALSPSLWNLGIIFGALVLSQYFEQPVFGAAVGVLLGGILQFLLQLPFMRKRAFFPTLSFQFKHPALRRILFLMLPAILGLSVSQFTVIFVRQFASFLEEGTLSYLFIADRLIQFPLGIFAVALGTAILPSLARHATDQDIASLKKTLSHGLRIVLLLTVPFMVGMIVLSIPIVKIVFQRGQFDLHATIITAQSLVAYSVGLWAASMIRVFAPAFYALKKPLIPSLAAVLGLTINFTLCFLLFRTLQHVGLALATSIAVTVNLITLITVFRIKYGQFGLRKMTRE